MRSSRIVLPCQSYQQLRPDHTIARTVAAMVPDGACIQMGVGSLPNLVCTELSKHKDLGIHTECFTPGMADLMERGVVNNRRKQINTGKSVFTFAMGQKRTYRYLDNNLSVESHPVDYTNNPAVIAMNDNVVSINAAIQIDLTGACNAEHLLGYQYSASGGQLDFVRGASASRGGKSIIALHSTAARGKVSRIVARLDGPVTTPRNDVQFIVTEFGCAGSRREVVDRTSIGNHQPCSVSQYFQETHPEHLFKDCSHFCEVVFSPEPDAAAA